MSHVDNVILAFDERETNFITQINEWMQNACRQSFGPRLAEVSSAYGGSKVLEADLYVGAFNYFPEADFVAFLKTLPWHRFTHVQIMIKRQWDEDGWSIISVKESQ